MSTKVYTEDGRCLGEVEAFRLKLLSDGVPATPLEETAWEGTAQVTYHDSTELCRRLGLPTTREERWGQEVFNDIQARRAPPPYRSYSR